MIGYFTESSICPILFKNHGWQWGEIVENSCYILILCCLEEEEKNSSVVILVMLNASFLSSRVNFGACEKLATLYL